MSSEAGFGDGSASHAFGEVRIGDVLLYRKAAITVVASYLGLDDAFVEAVLADRMEEFLESAEADRERLKTEHYDEYLSVLSREAVVRYAATVAESLALDPEESLASHRAVGGDNGALSLSDDVNAAVRVHEIFEFLESPDEDGAAEALLLATKRHLCDYYNACAFNLVKNQLLPVIVTAAEELCRDPGAHTLSAVRIRAMIIAGQERMR